MRQPMINPVVDQFLGTTDFIPHGHCYLWKPGLVWLHVLSDSFTALAYYSIPLTLFYFVRRRQDLPFNWIFLLFAVFIAACGTTHLLDVWTLWYPTYWLSGTVKAGTAIASLFTASTLVPLIPKVLAIASPAELEAANRELQREIAERKQAEMALRLQDLIVKSMAEGVCLVRATDNTIVYANPKFEQIFGYEPGELINQPVAIVNYEDEHTSAAAVAQMITQRTSQHGEITCEVHNVKKDGTPFWCRATAITFDHPDHGAISVAVQQDITEQKQAEAQIKASLREKEVLIKEIHHRVKNNLQIVDSLLQMQSRRTTDQRLAAILTDSQNRIASIALVHEKLYCSEDLASIDFSQYILDLTAHLFDSYSTDSDTVTLTTQVSNIFLDIETAIPCGMIISELVSNSLKYAFPNNRQGEIQVRFYTNGSQSLILEVQDDGIGIPASFSWQNSGTFGLTLVQALVAQLEGKILMDSNQGTQFKIYFSTGKA